MFSKSQLILFFLFGAIAQIHSYSIPDGAQDDESAAPSQNTNDEKLASFLAKDLNFLLENGMSQQDIERILSQQLSSTTEDENQVSEEDAIEAERTSDEDSSSYKQNDLLSQLASKYDIVMNRDALNAEYRVLRYIFEKVSPYANNVSAADVKAIASVLSLNDFIKSQKGDDFVVSNLDTLERTISILAELQLDEFVFSTLKKSSLRGEELSLSDVLLLKILLQDTENQPIPEEASRSLLESRSEPLVRGFNFQISPGSNLDDLMRRIRAIINQIQQARQLRKNLF